MLEWLRLDGNLIESLPTAALGPLRSVRGIDLHHNPWNCTCTLRPLRSWLAARNMPFSVPPLCLAPARLRGQSWNRMPLDELACPPKVHAVEALVQSVAGQPATLSCSVKSNPEAAVSWFFADRLIVNMTSDEANFHQVYFVREAGDKTDKVAQLVLNSAREQDSGFYVCQAVNRANKVAANVTLLVRGGGSEMTGSRGFTAGLILAVFAILIAVLLVCCVCSLKRARSNASMRMRRRASSMSGLQQLSNGLFDKSTDPFIQRQEDDRGVLKNRTNGYPAKPPTDDGSAGTPPEFKISEPTRFADKQWLVSRDPDVQSSPPVMKNPVRQSSVTSVVSDIHREIAMYQNQKVLFNPSPDSDSPRLMPSKTDRSSLSPVGSHSILSLPSQQQQSARNYPDLVDVLPLATDYEPSDAASIEEEVARAIKQHPLESAAVLPSARYLQRRNSTSGRRLSISESGTNSGSLLSQRHRLSDWELNEFDAHQDWLAYSYNPHQSDFSYDWDAGNSEVLTRHPDEFEEDFQRRYAYHTGQLNRFLFEYRALQKKLARMQDTWGRCLDAADFMAVPTVRQVRPSQYLAAPRPLRPILKNRLPPAVRPPTAVVRAAWPAHYPDGEDIVDSDSPPTPVNESPYDATDETYYS